VRNFVSSSCMHPVECHQLSACACVFLYYTFSTFISCTLYDDRMVAGVWEVVQSSWFVLQHFRNLTRWNVYTLLKTETVFPSFAALNRCYFSESWNSLIGIARGWTVWGSNPGMMKKLSLLQTHPDWFWISRFLLFSGSWGYFLE
jgi:hypothetical protein